jgi:hypothetical protein
MCLSLLYDCSQHGKKISIINCPNFLHYHTPQPLAVSALLNASVTDNPLAIGTQTGILEIGTPIRDKSSHGLFIDFLFFGSR